MNVIFVCTNCQWGHAIMRGYQISDELRTLGINSRVLSEVDLYSEIQQRALDKDTLLVFLREAVGNIETIQMCKDYGCKVILDYIDFGEPLAIGANYSLRYSMGENKVDGYIFPNKAYETDYSPFCREAQATCIYHHIDPRVGAHGKDDEFAVYALGSILSQGVQDCLLPTGFFNKNNLYTTDSMFNCGDENLDVADKKLEEHYKNYNCTVATRGLCNQQVHELDGYFFTNDILARYKSNVRLAFAVGARQVIVLGKEDAYQELLDDSYPYWIDGSGCNTADEVKSAIVFAQNTYKGKEWEIARDMLASLESRLSINNIAKEYIKFFKKVL